MNGVTLSTAMQPLEYETPSCADRRTPQLPTRPSPSIRLFVLPVVATCLAVWFILHNGNEEPFMVFSLDEALIHVACPILIAASWICWGVRADRDELSIFAVLPLATIAVLQVLLVLLLGASYFFEGWNS